ncbi:hypothetical protein K3495_g6827 [Podosphaera aphanis]|nr:hypothetical protein K3495_g6827 [Podosphaera aphanis]
MSSPRTRNLLRTSIKSLAKNIGISHDIYSLAITQTEERTVDWINHAFEALLGSDSSNAPTMSEQHPQYPDYLPKFHNEKFFGNGNQDSRRLFSGRRILLLAGLCSKHSIPKFAYGKMIIDQMHFSYLLEVELLGRTDFS